MVITATPTQEVPANGAVFNQLIGDLKIKKLEDLGHFFPTSPKVRHTELAAYIIALVKRLAHYIFTGIWINETHVGKLINEYRFTMGLSSSEERKICKAFESLTEPGKYESLFKNSMKETWVDKLSNGLSFLNNFIQHPLTVGAILPSSRCLAKRVTKHISSVQTTDKGCNFLEVGPGTGEFTYEVIKKLRPQDRLDLVEYDKQFCKILRQRFGHLSNVHINHISITDWTPNGYQYDGIVSGLPLNAFPSRMVEKVYEKFITVAKKGARLSYFEYPLLAKIKNAFISKKDKRDLDKVLKIKENFYKKFNGTSEVVWLNVPPASAKHCQIS